MLIQKNIEDLTLVEIDVAIAVLLKRYVVTIHQVGELSTCKIAQDKQSGSFPFRPSSEYIDGGPIAEYYKVASAWNEEKQRWFAQCVANGEAFTISHPDMLAAQMLAILRAHVGLHIEI